MVTLQWGTTIGYDILVFDKSGKVAFLEVKSSASHHERWILQKKYANPRNDAIAPERRFVCCVDLTVKNAEPHVYVFPSVVVAKALHYFYAKGFSNSESYMLALGARPRGRAIDADVKTVGEFINAQKYLDSYDALGVAGVTR
jgi:hypothetical protein